MKRIKKTKPKVAKIAYSTTLKKVDTRTVSNNMATTSHSIHRIQVPEQSQHSYIASTSQHVAKGKTRRKRAAQAGRQLGTSDDDLIDESDSDVSISYTEQPEDGPQQQVLQQIVPQHVVQEVIATGQSSTVDGSGANTGGINLMPQIGQVQYIQDTEDGQIIHYQLHDQYGQILQQDPGQQVIVTTQEAVPQEISYQHIVATTGQQDSGIYNVPLGESTASGSSITTSDVQQITQRVHRENDVDVLMSFAVPYKVETASSSGAENWQTTTVTTAVTPQQSPQQQLR